MEEKTYRAIRHDITRTKQRLNANEVHHPDEKIEQIQCTLNYEFGMEEIAILELFAGQGNLTKVYEKFGWVRRGEPSRGGE